MDLRQGAHRAVGPLRPAGEAARIRYVSVSHHLVVGRRQGCEGERQVVTSQEAAIAKKLENALNQLLPLGPMPTIDLSLPADYGRKVFDIGGKELLVDVSVLRATLRLSASASRRSSPTGLPAARNA